MHLFKIINFKSLYNTVDGKGKISQQKINNTHLLQVKNINIYLDLLTLVLILELIF